MKPKALTVKELIAKLRTCPPDDIVVLSSDPEGNEFWTVAETQLVTVGQPIHIQATVLFPFGRIVQ